MRRFKNQSGIALLETILVLAVIAAVVATGIYIKNRNNNTATSSQTTAGTTDYKKIATDSSKEGTVTSIDAAINGSASDESQAEQQSENSQANTAASDSSDANNVGDSVNENAINF